jgi:hypothetical protein
VIEIALVVRSGKLQITDAQPVFAAGGDRVEADPEGAAE